MSSFITAKEVFAGGMLDKQKTAELFTLSYPPGSVALRSTVGRTWNDLVGVCARLGLLGTCEKCGDFIGTCNCIHLWHTWASAQVIPMQMLGANRDRIIGENRLSQQEKGRIVKLFVLMDRLLAAEKLPRMALPGSAKGRTPPRPTPRRYPQR